MGETLNTVREIETYISGVLNQTLSNEESTIKQSFKIEVAPDGTGFFFVPRLPTSLIMDANLYYKVYNIVSFAVYPAFTMIRASSMQLASLNHSFSMARAFFFPWKEGVSQRLVGSLEYVANEMQNPGMITLMDGISFDFNTAPGLILTGPSGSGKSTALRTIMEIEYRIGHIILVDPKKSDGARWARQHENVRLLIPKVDDRPEDFLPVVNSMLAEMVQTLNQRQTSLYDKTEKISTDYRELGFAPIFIVIDEVASLTVGLKKALLDDFQSLLTQISLLGRESGIFLVLSMQEARHELLPVPVRSQMGVRILLGRIDRQTSQFLFPELEDGFPIPIGGKGSGIISISDGEHYGIEPIQMPTITES